jgi:uncharacterized protein (TIGR02452 family)
MTNRDRRAQIAQQTLDILNAGYYVSPAGKTIDISEALHLAVENSIHYSPDDFGQLFSRRDEIAASSEVRHMTAFRVLNTTTLSAARQAINVDVTAKVLCLNFASAKNPGGGFLNGSQAQEESLARGTGLYPCIVQMSKMYIANRHYSSCLYTDHMIYSPKVPVIRNDDDVLLEESYCVSIVTAPAVNAGAVMSNEKQNISRIQSTMLDRIEKILSIAAAHHSDGLILGAWGCGVFKNDPANVARWFHHHLIGNKAFSGLFKEVVFAVLDNSPDKKSIRAFDSVFRQSN